MENVNRNYKNSVFSLLFSNPDVLRELYSAIEGVDIPLDIPVDINTLSNVLFMSVEGLKLANADKIPLELIVQVYNINHGHNQKMLKKSENLYGYSFFVNKMREYELQGLK